jgi:hypothetical protein
MENEISALDGLNLEELKGNVDVWEDLKCSECGLNSNNSSYQSEHSHKSWKGEQGLTGLFMWNCGDCIHAKEELEKKQAEIRRQRNMKAGMQSMNGKKLLN